MRTCCLFTLLVLVGALSGAEHRSRHFQVEAATPKVARQIADAAETALRAQAKSWLGKALPEWDRPCPLKVTVNMNGSGGATSFAFDRGQILSIDMHVEGALDRLLASVVPHEATHVVLAHYFRQPVPRWADEGASVLSEDAKERRRHDAMTRKFIAEGRVMPLRRLFSLSLYPRDVMVLYAQGYSVTHFLVEARGRKTFLAFVREGMDKDWDTAVKDHYGYEKVDKLEQAWLRWVEHPSEGIPPAARHRPGRLLLCQQ